jgi:PTH2 family peptidyl-tRNA hydrolase
MASMPDDEVKIWIALRRDLNMPAGKASAQAGHAVATVLIDQIQNDVDDRNWARIQNYMQASQAKIVVAVDGLSELEEIKRLCDLGGLAASLIVDEGRTFFSEPTATCLAVGPCLRADLPPVMRDLRLY